ncbi:SurA N-terminal domain-containing protein [Phenylobacterium sp. J426]|uniref:peptidylprolyl isomerase n=1 Tax=Phenylobacterium sp. J426 TaxID=2898439 RepID=UPI002151E0B7|nr:peptidylprolyl isomerase [Phenylobacterium sp. J426]MCR5875651.1 SurA N-terminal domain-containing protein [Phenylobacterium sp. J426]
MLAAIRTFAKSWVAAILIGLLIVSFAIFGINDVFRGTMGDQVIKAGSRVINSAQFRREYDQYRKDLEQQAGQPITPEMASENGIDRQVLSGLATREAFAEMLSRMGIRPSDKLLVAEIQKIPAFFDPISGRFDRKTFEQRLGENGLRPEDFDRVLADQMAAQHWGSGVGEGLRAPRAYGALAAIYGLESRNVAYFNITPASVPAVAAPTDAQLTQFMQQNAAQLTRPEMRVLTVVRFSPQAVAANAPVDPAELQKLYDFRRDTLSQPETRTLVQIPAKDAAAAQQIQARLERGEAPAAVAKAVGVDAITYENRPRTAIADRRVAEAAFRLPAGQVAQAQGELGLAVVKVLAITPGRTITLEEARPMLEAELRKNAAAQKAYDLAQAYDQAHQGGADLAAAAQKAGVPAMTVGPVVKQGVDAQGRPVAGLTPQILEQAFSLPGGGESDLVDAGEGEFFAVKVERIVPPTLPPLAEVRTELARVWTARETASRMETRANELADRIRKGESLAAVAASAGTSVSQLTELSRQNAGQRQDVSRELMARAFATKPNEVFVTRAREFAFSVGQVGEVRMQPGPLAAMLAEQSRPELASTMFREIADSAQAAARTKLKVRTDVNRARAAIGMEPLAAEGKAETKK